MLACSTNVQQDHKKHLKISRDVKGKLKKQTPGKPVIYKDFLTLFGRAREHSGVSPKRKVVNEESRSVTEPAGENGSSNLPGNATKKHPLFTKTKGAFFNEIFFLRDLWNALRGVKGYISLISSLPIVSSRKPRAFLCKTG